MARKRTAATTTLGRNKEKQFTNHCYTATTRQLHPKNCLSYDLTKTELSQCHTTQKNTYSILQTFKYGSTTSPRYKTAKPGSLIGYSYEAGFYNSTRRIRKAQRIYKAKDDILPRAKSSDPLTLQDGHGYTQISGTVTGIREERDKGKKII